MSEPSPEKPRRRFWQISLLTLLLTTFVTAALFVLNTRIVSQRYTLPGATYWEKDKAREYLAIDGFRRLQEESYRGWPFVFWQNTNWVAGQDFQPIPVPEIPKELRDTRFIFGRELYCFVDSVIFVSILRLQARIASF